MIAEFHCSEAKTLDKIEQFWHRSWFLRSTGMMVIP
jgi:hypothetical protein